MSGDANICGTRVPDLCVARVRDATTHDDHGGHTVWELAFFVVAVVVVVVVEQARANTRLLFVYVCLPAIIEYRSEF